MSSVKKKKLSFEDHFGTATEEEKKQILEEKQAKNTNKSTKSHIKLLRDYLLIKEKPVIENTADKDLPEL